MPFYLFDTINLGRNIGMSSTKIGQILKEFKKAAEYLQKYKQVLLNVVTQREWYSVQSVDDKVLNQDPELNQYANINLIDAFINNSYPEDV